MTQPEDQLDQDDHDDERGREQDQAPHHQRLASWPGFDSTVGRPCGR